MAIETLTKMEPEAVIAQLKEMLGSDDQAIEAFATMEVGPNDEKGFLQFCPDCDDYTGHLSLTGTHWYFERCLRDRRHLRAWEIVAPRWPRVGKPVVMQPGMDSRAALQMVLEVTGPDYFARLFEVWFERRVKARMAELAKELKMAALERSL